MISIDLPNWNLRFKCAKNQNVLEIVSLPQTVQSHSTPEFVKRSCADMKETYRHMKKHRAVTIRISYFCIELVSKQLCQVLWILQRNDSCTMALFKRKVNVFVMAERSRDDELNRTVQAETRQGRAEFVCRSHVRAKGEWSTLHLLTLQYSIIICISISMNLFSYIIILNNYRYFFRDIQVFKHTQMVGGLYADKDDENSGVVMMWSWGGLWNSRRQYKWRTLKRPRKPP